MIFHFLELCILIILISPCKKEIIEIFGPGRGAIIMTNQELMKLGFNYHPVDELSDDFATGIIQGIDELLRTKDA